MSGLCNLVGAVRAFAAGDYAYSLEPSGSAEVKELGAAFDAMRQRVVESQRRALEAARLAALGRAAASISHDLRHHLAALVANAEFLHEAENLGFDRDESYHEVQRASEQMTGLIDSLIEVAREQNSITPTEAQLEDVVRRASDAVRASPEFRGRAIEIRADCSTTGMFDSRKLVRMRFGDNDVFLGGEVIEDPAEIVRHNYWRDAAWHYALTRDDFATEQSLGRV